MSEQEKMCEFIKKVLSRKIYETLKETDLAEYNITIDVIELCDGLAEEINRGVINYMIKRGIRKFDVEVYKSRIRQLKWNLTQKDYIENGIPTLLDKILRKEATLKVVCEEYTHREMCPDRFIQADYELEQEFKHKYGIIDPMELPDGAIQCGSCKSWKTSYIERQIRRADEPATLFVTCHKCKKNWRMG